MQETCMTPFNLARKMQTNCVHSLPAPSRQHSVYLSHTCMPRALNQPTYQFAPRSILAQQHFLVHHNRPKGFTHHTHTHTATLHSLYMIHKRSLSHVLAAIHFTSSYLAFHSVVSSTCAAPPSSRMLRTSFSTCSSFASVRLLEQKPTSKADWVITWEATESPENILGKETIQPERARFNKERL
jgi:hypothetical protein